MYYLFSRADQLLAKLSARHEQVRVRFHLHLQQSFVKVTNADSSALLDEAVSETYVSCN